MSAYSSLSSFVVACVVQCKGRRILFQYTFLLCGTMAVLCTAPLKCPSCSSFLYSARNTAFPSFYLSNSLTAHKNFGWTALLFIFLLVSFKCGIFIFCGTTTAPKSKCIRRGIIFGKKKKKGRLLMTLKSFLPSVFQNVWWPSNNCNHELHSWVTHRLVNQKGTECFLLCDCVCGLHGEGVCRSVWKTNLHTASWTVTSSLSVSAAQMTEHKLCVSWLWSAYRLGLPPYLIVEVANWWWLSRSSKFADWSVRF